MKTRTIGFAAMAVVGGWLSTAHALPLIDATRGNGSFETMNGGVPITAKISQWDLVGSDIDHWTQWTAISTTSGDSGVEYNNAAGSNAAFLQNGNAVCNLTSHVAREGDVFTFTFKVPSRADKAFDIALVYEESAGGPIRQVVPSTFHYQNTGSSGASYFRTYTVSAADAMIGKAMGVGILNPTGYPNIDDVTLGVSERAPAPTLIPSMAGDLFTLAIGNLVTGSVHTLLETVELTGGEWELAAVIAPESSTALWQTHIAPETARSFYKIGVPGPESAIRSGVGWYDDHGNPVSAHGANIVKEGGLFYLFGEFKSDSGNAFAGFSCYSSPDLCHWTFENIVLPVQPSGRLGPDRVGERPKVMKCPATGEYVMFMHTDSLTYSDQRVGYATCDTIDGNYTFQGPLMNGSSTINMWDMGVFQDDDGTGYLITHSGFLYKLAADYKSVVATTVNGAFGDCESPAIFKRDGTYYWLGSGLTGWERNDNYYYTATNIAGPWTFRGNIAPAGTLTWNCQTTFVLPIVGSETTTWMFMGDRWSHPYQRSAATYVWQPLNFENGTISIPEYHASWNVDVATGHWYPSDIPGNRVVENSDTGQITYSAGWEEASPSAEFQDTRSDVADASFTFEFTGTRVGIYGVGRPDGGYARAEIRDGTGATVLSRVFETYCKYPESSLKFLSPVLPQGDYTLVVTVLGEHWSWTLKNGTVTGSSGNHVSLDRIVVK